MILSCRSEVSGPFLSFLLPYFFYDIYAMYSSYSSKFRRNLCVFDTFFRFSRHNILLMFHHIGIVIFAYPIVLDLMVSYYLVFVLV